MPTASAAVRAMGQEFIRPLADGGETATRMRWDYYRIVVDSTIAGIDVTLHPGELAEADPTRRHGLGRDCQLPNRRDSAGQRQPFESTAPCPLAARRPGQDAKAVNSTPGWSPSRCAPVDDVLIRPPQHGVGTRSLNEPGDCPSNIHRSQWQSPVRHARDSGRPERGEALSCRDKQVAALRWVETQHRPVANTPAVSLCGRSPEPALALATQNARTAKVPASSSIVRSPGTAASSRARTERSRESMERHSGQDRRQSTGRIDVRACQFAVPLGYT
jgi:hypothetical protein